MRLVVLACVCVAALAFPLSAKIEKKPLIEVTVILDFKGPHAETSLIAMKRESSLIMRSSGVQLNWRMPGEEPVGDANLVVMAFHGSCMFGSAPRRYNEPGPYGSTRITDGDVQPFGDIDCDRVMTATHDAISDDPDCARADFLMGRALGRVVAHELVHILTKSNRHGTEGVAKASLSGRELIEPSLTLSLLDIERVKREFPAR